MELDRDTLESLPRSQRLRFAKKARQEQLKKFYQREYEESLQEKEEKISSPNKKGQHVSFDVTNRLRDAVTRFDDKEVLSLLEQGADPNTCSENGITLLHQCCMDDNITIAELLIQRGADVNRQDDDWWTPLHAACACEVVEIVQLLLSNGADPTILDIDANLPIDHTPTGSETRHVMQQHLEQNGLDETALKNLKRRDALRMLADVKDFLLTGGDINTSNENGTTLLHIAAANNYREVGKLLVDRGADIDPIDDEGMTPLHVASKFGNLRMVKLLVRRNANPNLQNNDEEKPIDLAATELIEEILKSAEQVYLPNQKESTVSIVDDEEDTADTNIHVEQDVEIIVDRTNSKTQRRHVSIAKTEMVFEAQTRVPGDEEKRRSSSEGFRGLGLKVVPDDKAVYLPNPSTTDDLASMSELTENMILQELMLRYSKDVIYTYVGDILIAVNPFKQLPIYSMQVSDKYNELRNRGDLTPHIFGLTDNAYQSMLREGKSQCCIISGESGAGKTETGKFVVQHLLARAHSSESLLSDKIEQVNPLLECFGNAQTVMNDNSSRFGKYLELLFSNEGRVQGARISEYLLEKSRVIQQGERERNFHIFYMLFAGLTDDEKEQYGLMRPEDHSYLKSSPNICRSVYDNCRAKFAAVKDCLSLIGFTKDDEDSLFRTLSAVLLLGDLEFEESGDAARLINPEVLDKVALLLQVSGDELASAIMSETTYTRGEAITKVRNVAQANECRDALAKAIYHRLFSWMVNNINQLLQPLEDSELGYEIGILDIFGFENFNKNSFEQMCINLANEQLQNYFNEHIFLQEQDECEREGISLDRINFTNNKPVVDVFLEKHLGIIALMDEESHFPRSTDKSLATKLHNGPGVRSKNIYKAPKDGGLSFEIFHYAGIVNYDLNGVLEKNKDTLAKSVQFTMKTSSSPLIREMFQFRITRTGSLAPSVRQRESRKSTKSIKKPRDAFEFFKQKRKSDRQSRQQRRKKNERPVIGIERKGPATVAFHFKNSLSELMSKMKKSSPHFVRCIKPNTAKLPDKFTPEYVIAQLRYTGVMETTRIRREGFPMRLTAQEFLQRYTAMELFSGIDRKKLDEMGRCKATLSHYNIKEWQVGYSKLFFRYWHVEKLNDISIQFERKIITCQKVVRGFVIRRAVKPLFERKNAQQAFVGKFLAGIETKGQEFQQRQQVQNEYDEQRMVENFFEDVINIAEMEAQNLKQQNGSVNGAVPSDSTQAYPRDSTYVPMSGVATQQTMSAESYTSQEDYFNMNPYDETEVYVSSERLGTPRKSVLPYQPTCKSLKISETDQQDIEEMEERIVDRRMSDDVFTNGGHVNGGMMPPPPPPPPQMLDLQGMPPPPPPPPPPTGPTMAQNIPQAPPAPPPSGATLDHSIPQAPQQSGDESIYSIPQAPPAPPPTSAGIGHIPQAPPMQAPPQGQPTLGYDSGMPMPPPPPPAPEPALTQNGHVRSKSEDTYMEGVSGDDVPPPPPPMPEGAVIVDDGLPEDFPPPPPMAEFSSEAKQNIAAIRNKFLQEEKTKDVEPTSPQPTPGQQRKQSPRGSGNDETLTEIGLQPGIAAKLAHFHEKQQELSSPPPQPKHNNGASPRKFITPAAAPIYQQPEEIVRKRPPAPTRDPTTRLTMIGNQRLSGIPETGMGSNQSPYAVPDHKRQQQQQQQFRNRTQSTPTSGVAGSADYAHMPNLKQIQRLSMQDVPPPPSTPPPRPPSINMKNIPPAPAEAPPPLPERSPRRSSGGAYQQGMSPRMSPPQTQAAPSPPLPPQAYNKRPVSASIPPPPSLTSIPPPPSVTNPGYAVAPSPPPPAPPSNMARSVPPSSMHIPQQYGNGGMPHQANMASQQYMSMGVPSHPPSKSVPPPPQAPIYSSMNTVPPPPPPNNLTYMPTTMDIPATQSNHSIYSQPHDTFNPPPPPPQYQMGIPPPPAPSYQRNIPQPPPPSGIPPPPPVVPSVPPPPTAPVPPRIPPSSMGGLHNGIGNVQLRRTERPEKKMSTGEAPMDNLMAELQSGFRLRPTPKQQKAPSNGGQVVESPHRAEPPRVSPKTRPLSGQFPPPPLAAMSSNIPPAAMTSNIPPAAMTSNIPPPVKSPGPAPKPKPKKKSIPNAEYEHSYPANGSSGLPPEIEEELASLPPWKRALREKKIREELKKKEEENKKKQEEEAKWAGIPDWKKQMILKKEKKKQEEAEAAIDKEAMELEKKLQAMPAWKREIVQKKMAMEEGPGNNNHA